MKLTKLEGAVISRMLADCEMNFWKSSVDLDKVLVKAREYTGTGCITEFRLSGELQLLGSRDSRRWGNVGARVSSLNTEGLDLGFLIYIDDGFLTCMESYTYGEAWPDHINGFELYDLASSSGATSRND